MHLIWTISLDKIRKVNIMISLDKIRSQQYILFKKWLN